MADKPEGGWEEREAKRHPAGLVALVHMLKTRGLGETLHWMALTDPGLGPQAFVMKGPNAAANAIKVSQRAAQLYQELERNPDIWSQITSKPLKEAVSYIQAKYPRLSGLVGKWVEHTGGGSSNEASFSPKMAWGAKGEPPKGRIEFTSGWRPETAESRVEQTGHELTHAVQQRKTGDFPGYIPARKSEGGIGYLDPEQYQRYLSQPYEVQARRGGKTALKTFNEYMRLLGMQKEPH